MCEDNITWINQIRSHSTSRDLRSVGLTQTTHRNAHKNTHKAQDNKQPLVRGIAGSESVGGGGGTKTVAANPPPVTTTGKHAPRKNPHSRQPSS